MTCYASQLDGLPVELQHISVDGQFTESEAMLKYLQDSLLV